jgi:predicted NAD/FAD-binding protein
VRFILEFYHHHGLLSVRNRPQWQVIQGGSKNYLAPLVRGYEQRIHLRTPVVGLQRDDEQVSLRLQSGERFECDQVLFACHSDQALRILGNQATNLERELLAAFPYESNDVVLHTDTRLLPRNRRAWACWNYFVPATAVEKATVTYNMNMLQRLTTTETYCVTLNNTASVDPARVLRRFTYHHPVFNSGRRAAQARYAALVGANRTSYCGAYWRNGFHEDGVWSAFQACRPWLKQEGPWNHAFTRGASDIVGIDPSRMHFATPSP